MPFQKGYDPKRYVASTQGITAYRKKFSDLMQDKAHLAVEYMLEVLQDPKASQKLRVEVAKDICDRFYGKAVDRVQVATMDATGGQDVQSMSTAQLEQLIANLDASRPAGHVIDGEKEEKVIESRD